MQTETELADRILRFDGVSIVEPDKIVRAMLLGCTPSNLQVTQLTAEIEQFNSQVEIENEIVERKNQPLTLNFNWKLPKEYLELDIFNRIGTDLLLILDKYSPQQQNAVIDRMLSEFQEIEKRGMIEFFRTVIYILDRFKQEKIVWGVGRGSSCACFCLYILGLHSVDCILYEVPMEEFFHD